MRKTSAVIGACVLGLAPVVAAGAASAGTVFHTSFHGRVALAAWTTCPHPQLGDQCADTVVITSDARVYENSDQPTGGHFLHDRGDRIVLQRFWYEMRLVDGQLSAVPTRESFGGTGPGGATVRVDQRLTRANAQATAIRMHTTDYVNGTETEETASVSVSWTPDGALTRIADADRLSGPDFLLRFTTRGWSRQALAAGVVNGGAVQGVGIADGTELFAVRQLELSVFKGRPLD